MIEINVSDRGARDLGARCAAKTVLQMSISLSLGRGAAPRGAGPALLAVLILASCAAAGRPIPITPGEPVELGTFAFTLPPNVDWEGGELGDPREGRMALFGREFTSTHTLLAAALPDLVPPRLQAEYGAKMAGRSDPERLELALKGIEADAPTAEPGVVENFRCFASDRPAQRQGASCDEYGYETIDRRVPGYPGEPVRMVLRGYVCIDPMTRRPIQIAYSERYLETAEQLRPAFEQEKGSFFNSLRFGPRAADS